ncbi:MAG TPA: TIGR02996 domain-containing protein [Gemmataceae bacterium]|nr:TIGR02996 domain-containing protein [Gemmataceae bacterium]
MATKRRKPRILTQEDEAFLSEILAAPEDDTIRLRYADWLKANGDPERAEFIRLDIRTARVGGQRDRRWSQHFARREALRKAYGEEWLARVPLPMRLFVSFVRGFPGRVDCDIQEFLSWDVALWQASPETKLVTTLSLRTETLSSGDLDVIEVFRKKIGPRVEALAAAPQLAQIVHLEMDESGIRTKLVKSLVASPYLIQLRSLDLSYNGLGAGAAQDLSVTPRLPNLELLRLNGNRIGDAGAWALAGSPYLPALAELYLKDNAIGDEGGRGLAASKCLANLRTLDLTANSLSEKTCAALRKTFGRRVIL